MPQYLLTYRRVMAGNELRMCPGDVVDHQDGPRCSLGEQCKARALGDDREAYRQAHGDYGPPDWLVEDGGTE